MPGLWQLVTLRRFAARATQDAGILLRLGQYYPMVEELDFAKCVTFFIMDRATGQQAGEIALRIGESDSLFYLGHIGYHIDPPYRGRHYAERACRLCLPLLKEFGMRSLVITTDEDNGPSIRTCERLGCQLECTVEVPRWCWEKFQISHRKRRYVLILA